MSGVLKENGRKMDAHPPLSLIVRCLGACGVQSYPTMNIRRIANFFLILSEHREFKKPYLEVLFIPRLILRFSPILAGTKSHLQGRTKPR